MQAPCGYNIGVETCDLLAITANNLVPKNRQAHAIAPSLYADECALRLMTLIVLQGVVALRNYALQAIIGGCNV